MKRTCTLSRGVVACCFVLGLCFVLPAFAQSGRRQEPAKTARPTPGPGPIADPNRPGGSIKSSKKDADEIEANDVVRITSNLVPIPVSAVDAKGNAVINLKLEDFELRVDGQPQPLSDLTRAETSVRLAVLFDNSGSLDFARDFEKHAAIRFFRKVMRAKDEAAIYSISTDSFLAQPLTNDVVRLEQTVAGFGKPEGGTSLFNAIFDAATYLRPYSGRRVIVIVSDGIRRPVITVSSTRCWSMSSLMTVRSMLFRLDSTRVQTCEHSLPNEGWNS